MKEELVQEINQDGSTTGKILEREQARREGKRMKGCSCFVVQKDTKEILIETRQKGIRDSGMIDLCSGHVRAGETSTQGMVRELEEELGLPIEETSNIQFLGSYPVDFSKQGKVGNYLVDFYYLITPKKASDFILQQEEVEKVEYVSLDTLIQMQKEQITRVKYEEGMDSIYQKLKFAILERNRQQDQRE